MLAACWDGLESNMLLYTLEISTLLRFKSHTKISVLMCEQKPYLVWLELSSIEST